MSGLWQVCAGTFLVLVLQSTVSTMRRISPYNPKNPPEPNGKIDYKTFYFTQQVDHFGFENSDTFSQRYLMADQYWFRGNGPIFFYTGNEGDITWFCNNTGFLWDIVLEFNALLIFAEHRYYGETLPYGNDSYKDSHHLNYLTSEQALADFGSLIMNLKATLPGAKDVPVVAFGGSYGGMLAAWFRIKYPNVVVGSLAASAPIFEFSELTACETYLTTVTQPYNQTSKYCAGNIRLSWDTFNKFGATESGREFITSTFKLCKPLTSVMDVTTFKNWLTNSWGDLAMVNYPYPANFLEPLPGWPIKKACAPLSSNVLDGEALVKGIYEAINVYFNYTGMTTCMDINQQATASLGDKGWGYQACTEMVQASCANGMTDMFEPFMWNLTDFANQCVQTWKFPITPRPDWGPLVYWGKNLTAASNIIFSNGLLDPWSTSGVLESVSDTVIAIIIPDGAHHLDLRSSNPDDPPDVIAARKQEVAIINKWIMEYWTSRH